jgi:hypothetical protein
VSWKPEDSVKLSQSLVERLCNKIGIRAGEIYGLGPFALPIYWRNGAPQRYAYHVAFPSSVGDRAVFFLRRYGLSRRPHAVLLKMMGPGPIRSMPISIADFETICAPDMRYDPDESAKDGA